MKNIFKLIRAEQWVKNFFVFLPLFFSRNIFHTGLLVQTSFAFLIFCFTASCVYILNDYVDADVDRKHPEKKNRPLASGAISKNTALVGLALLLLAAAMVFYCFQLRYPEINSWKFASVVLAYFILNIFYTFKLKHVAIVDVCIIALGFVFRVMAGGWSADIIISQWAILLTFVLALVLAIGKRRGELINAQISGRTRKALDGYNVQFADIALSISVTLAIVAYIMYTLTEEVQRNFGAEVFYTVVLVVFAFLRYLQQTLVYNKTESPTKIVYRDRYIQATVILWLGAFLLLIYYR